MSRKSFDPKECIGGLNTIKRGIQMIGKPVTKEYLLNSLKNCGLPSNANFWTVFRNSGIIQEVSKGKFVFCSKEPIYWERLATIKRNYQELLRKYHRIKQTPKGDIKEAPKEAEILKEQVVEIIPDIESAINLLKKNGYQILTPIGVLYKII